MGFIGKDKIEQFKQIVEGWTNYVFENEETEKIAKERLKICLECPNLINDKIKCKLCGCYMNAKTRSMTAKCPIKKW